MARAANRRCQARRRAAEQAIALDSGDALAHAVLGLTLSFARRYDEGIDILTRAIQINPNLAEPHGYLAVVHGLSGDYEACVENVGRASRLSPYDIGRALWLAGSGIAAFINGRYEDVIAIATGVVREFPTYVSAYRQRAAAYAALGRLDEARAELQTVLRLVPGLTISQVRVGVPVKSPEAMERWLDALRKAGLPE